jgi:Cytochrome P460
MRSRVIVAAGSCLLAVSLPFLLRPVPAARAAASGAPAYAQNGDLLPVTNYREWTYLTSGLGMSYTAKPSDMLMFDNVFVNPESYRSFLATGTWPDKTVMILEVREAKNKGSINQQGHFQGTDLMGIEAHVKDEARFPGQWAFFGFDPSKPNGTLIPQNATCYSCHREHGAVDTTFVQFYPTLLPVAREKKTLTDAFLKEEASQPAGQ